MTENEALKELNECIGKCVYGGCYGTAMHTAILTLNEIQQYRAIGTVEECREAKERQRARKPVKYGDTRQGLDNDGNSISWQEDCFECPNCESFLGYVSDCKDEQYRDDCCRNCGQAIDWSE